MNRKPIDPIMRVGAVKAATGNPKSTLYLRVAQGLLTPPIKIGARSAGWPSSEIAALNAARIAGKSDDDIRRLVMELMEARRVG